MWETEKKCEETWNHFIWLNTTDFFFHRDDQKTSATRLFVDWVENYFMNGLVKWMIFVCCKIIDKNRMKYFKLIILPVKRSLRGWNLHILNDYWDIRRISNVIKKMRITNIILIFYSSQQSTNFYNFAKNKTNSPVCG
jgi:hypothetical protein